MPIITVSRGSFSGGKALAEAVARKLGYRCIGREEIVKRAAAWGVSEEALNVALEKPPSFLGQSPQTKYMYLAFIQAALTQEVRNGKAVYHGLAGHVLLGKGCHVLRTRIVAPMEFRIAQVHDRLQHGRKEAIAYIEKLDQDRRKWTKFLYDVDWTDASFYDLVLNLENMSLDEACEVVCFASRLKCFEFAAACQQSLDNLALASRVKASLAREPETADLQFEVTAKAGSVSIKGDIISPGQAKCVADIVRAVPGVETADLHELELVTAM